MLSTAELDAALKGVGTLRLAPSQDRLIADLRARLATSSRSDFEDVRGMQLLAAMVRGHRNVVSPDVLDVLLAQRIHLVRADVCNARALHLLPGEPAIVLFSGLLKLLMFSIAHRIVVAQIAKHIGYSTQGTAITDMASDQDLPEPVASLIQRTYLSRCATVHFFRDAAPLPHLGRCLTQSAKSNAMFSLCQSLWFILMHELGHIRLGHLSGSGEDPDPFVSPALAIAEPINWMKHREFSADAYCINSLSADSRLYGLNYSMDVLTVFEFMESHLRPPRNSHPMALNRMENILKIYGTPADPSFANALATVSAHRKLAFDAKGGASLDRTTATSMFERAAPMEECARAAASLGDDYRAASSDVGFADLTITPARGGSKREVLARLWDHFIDRWWDTGAPLPAELSPVD